LKTFAERFSSLRYPGETQKEFAHRLGITQASISRYLRGQHPDRMALAKIGEATGLSVDWMLSGKEMEISAQADNIIHKVGARMSRPSNDKEWSEISMTYFDEMKSLTLEEKAYIKHIIRDFVNDAERRVELIDYWNYMKFRDKNPSMPTLKHKRGKKHY
jgi:transcriptional regulator with XRE-family HTH domain